MTHIELLLTDAVNVLKTEEDTPRTRAMIAVLHAGLTWFDDFEEYALPSWATSQADRNFKITPEGRAALQLAEAVLGVE